MNRAVFVTIAAVMVLGGLWLYSTQYPPGPRVTNYEECEKAGYDIFLSFPAQCVTPEGKSFTQEIKSFDDCERAGYPIMESYPRQCKTNNGKLFVENLDKITVRAFFSSSAKDPNALNCEMVYPIAREISKTEAVGRAALQELLKGPTAEEKNNGFVTNINSGVKIQKLTIQDGVAKVDFNDRLEYQIGGACKVTAIRAQIEETLKQFSTVSKVIISINGRTEDILQP
jgi:hypothetical protein